MDGDSRGRDLGFPTANIDYPGGKILPANGIYACRASIAGDRRVAAVNVGVRPQFHSDAHRSLVEAHILDFDEDLYGQDVELEFIARLRNESKFASVDALVQQIGEDVKQTRALLSKN